jgi:hypothetical protein
LFQGNDHHIRFCSEFTDAKAWRLAQALIWLKLLLQRSSTIHLQVLLRLTLPGLMTAQLHVDDRQLSWCLHPPVN